MDSIILLTESLRSFERMSDEDAGAILKALLRHANGADVELNDSPVVQAVYPLIEAQVDRMAELREKRAASGASGGLAKASKAVANPSKAVANPSNDVANTKQTVAPVPVPKPIREKDILTDIPKEKDELLDAEPVASAFKEYEQMRNKIKKPLTNGARDRARAHLKTLCKGDADLAVKILTQSVDHCWQGLFELKQDTGGVVIKKPNSFFDFDQRHDDLDEILRRQM